MSNRPYGVSRWRFDWRRNLILSAFVALAIVVSSGLWWAYPRFSSEKPAALPNTTAPASIDPSLGVQQYGSQDDMTRADNQMAVAIKAEHPEFYRCRTYPADNALTRADLIPTANFNLVMTYDKAKASWKVETGSGLDLKIQTINVEGEGTNGKKTTYRAQRITWSYPSSVKLFGGFEYWSGAKRWSVHNVAPDDMGGYGMTLSTRPSDVNRVVVIATNTADCGPGAVSLPQDFDFTSLADDGLLVPQA